MPIRLLAAKLNDRGQPLQMALDAIVARCWSTGQGTTHKAALDEFGKAGESVGDESVGDRGRVQRAGCTTNTLSAFAKMEMGPDLLMGALWPSALEILGDVNAQGVGDPG